MALGLRVGDWVEVRSEAEILATLDDKGTLDALPLMPEMLAFCGKRLMVVKRADKTCDTIHYSGSRRLFDTVHLEGARCTGSAHGGCQALCLIYWKESWLKRVDAPAESASSGFPSAVMTREALQRTTEYPSTPGETEIRYSCQATEILNASHAMRWWDPAQYWRDVSSGNITAMAVVRAGLFRIFRKLLNLKGYRMWMWSYEHLQRWRGGTPYPFRYGKLDKTPRETLDLQPGEWVQVKSHEEILATVNTRNRNRGLSFDPEMVRYCGGNYRVLARAEQIIDERNGKMVALPNDCIILEGVICLAEYSGKRLFCPRSLYPFWREIWLKRVPGPGGGAVRADASRSGAAEHA